MTLAAIADRNTPEIMSAPPAHANITSTSAALWVRPAIAIAAPHPLTATSTARPWWRTRPVQPLNNDAMNMPAATDESRKP